ncbi:transglutaminase family protein [Phreatobacter aquaticus]|uniref:Transglutaminase family protein n=1 Tax=Phreatobacter aquaticus TaxID=2570229 RepID=A0A4D7QMR9_9HYPH|nr:transglutaminase family protein [Phreatobacter aquaticus]QCK86796.1 transglutaminase family protein [Phreatobacter aquaticus]
MLIRYGYSIEIACDIPTPVIAMLDIHPTRWADIERADTLSAIGRTTGQKVDVSDYQDGFGNICRRLIAPAGGVTLAAEGLVRDSGEPDAVAPDGDQLAPEHLPDDVLVYLLGSRYCETDRLNQVAWSRFGHIQGGRARVQAICDFVHGHLTFNYKLARPTRTASEAYDEQLAVCRDFAHLAITLCRAMNIPARYCTGYLGDIGVPRDPNPMDFSAWFEVFLGDRWWTYDARHNTRRIGRIVMARGRDATDVAILNSFGLHALTRFDVITDEVPAEAVSRVAAA